MTDESQKLTPAQLEELRWQAFCYLSDELNQNERSQFEKRLADDPNAQEALIKAVELVQLTTASLPTRIKPTVATPPKIVRDAAEPYQNQTQHWVGYLIGASVLILLAGSLWWIVSKPDPNSAVAKHREGSANEVAEVWVQSLDDDEIFLANDASDDDSEWIEQAIADDENGDLSWLIEALRETAGSITPMNDSPMIN
jgi:ferric-dicitrate binding protein FerR (iron transport regulator)